MLGGLGCLTGEGILLSGGAGVGLLCVCPSLAVKVWQTRAFFRSSAVIVLDVDKSCLSYNWLASIYICMMNLVDSES